MRSKNTEPEMMLRRELHRRGLRYRVHAKLPGRPDIVFASARVAVFVDGDFWHGFGWQERGFTSWQAQFDRHRDPDKWRAKIGGNIARDAQVNEQLTGMGWRVERVLESVLRRDVESAASDLERVIRELR